MLPSVFRVENFELALADCNFAIKFNSGNVKAHYRKALCLQDLKDFEQASFAIEVGLQCVPGDNNLLELQRKIRPIMEDLYRRRNSQLTSPVRTTPLFDAVKKCLLTKGYHFAQSYGHVIQQQIQKVS